MSAYKFHDPDGIYFITLTVVEWVDIFTRKIYVDIVLKSLEFCQKNKGLNVHAWCIMSNHLHMIVSRNEPHNLSDIMRDFKKYTSKQIIYTIESSYKESRRNWMLWIFESAGKKNRNNSQYKFWKQDNHAVHLFSNKFMDQKLNYIHNNPVANGVVLSPQEYVYSSAKDYCGQKGLSCIDMIQ